MVRPNCNTIICCFAVDSKGRPRCFYGHQCPYYSHCNSKDRRCHCTTGLVGNGETCLPGKIASNLALVCSRTQYDVSVNMTTRVFAYFLGLLFSLRLICFGSRRTSDPNRASRWCHWNGLTAKALGKAVKKIDKCCFVYKEMRRPQDLCPIFSRARASQARNDCSHKLTVERSSSSNHNSL